MKIDSALAPERSLEDAYEQIVSAADVLSDLSVFVAPKLIKRITTSIAAIPKDELDQPFEFKGELLRELDRRIVDTGLILGRIMEETEKELSGSAEGHDFDDDLPEDDYNLRPEVRGDVAWKALALVTAFIWGSLVTITFLSPAMLKDYMYWLTTGTAILTAVAIILRSRFKPTVEVERIDSEVLKDALLRANQFLNVKGVIDVNALAAVIARTDLVTFAKAALILRRNGLANNYVAQVAENLLSSGGLLVGTQSPDRSLFENAKQQLQDALQKLPRPEVGVRKKLIDRAERFIKEVEQLIAEIEALRNRSFKGLTRYGPLEKLTPGEKRDLNERAEQTLKDARELIRDLSTAIENMTLGEDDLAAARYFVKDTRRTWEFGRRRSEVRSLFKKITEGAIMSATTFAALVLLIDIAIKYLVEIIFGIAPLSLWHQLWILPMSLVTAYGLVETALGIVLSIERWLSSYEEALSQIAYTLEWAASDIRNGKMTIHFKGVLLMTID